MEAPAAVLPAVTVAAVLEVAMPAVAEEALGGTVTMAAAALALATAAALVVGMGSHPQLGKRCHSTHTVVVPQSFGGNASH